MTDLWRHDQARIDPPEEREDLHGDDCRCPECDPDLARDEQHDQGDAA